MRVATNQRYVLSKRKSYKIPEQVVPVSYIHVCVIQMFEKDTATEIKLDTEIKKSSEHFLPQRLKQSTTWTAQVSNIIQYICANAKKKQASHEKNLR